MKARKSPFLNMKTAMLLLGAAMLIPLASANAAVFAKYDGIDGESKDDNHDKWIDVLSIDWGAHKPGGGATGQSRRRGGAVVEDVTLTIEYEKASPKLQEKCLKGEIIPKLEIEIVADRGNGKQEPYLTYKLKDVIVTSYSFGADGQGNAALLVSMNYTQIEWTYTALDGKKTTAVVDKRKGSIKVEEEGEGPADPGAAGVPARRNFPGRR